VKGRKRKKEGNDFCMGNLLWMDIAITLPPFHRRGNAEFSFDGVSVGLH
jgi:hypothetical protein